jgi:hypothetical protein
MVGIGLTMEGIEQNPVVYEFMMENSWRAAPWDPYAWLQVSNVAVVACVLTMFQSIFRNIFSDACRNML